MSKTIEERCVEGDSNYPLCLALRNLDALELMPKNSSIGSGLVKKADIAQLLQWLELELLKYYGDVGEEGEDIN